MQMSVVPHDMNWPIAYVVDLDSRRLDTSTAVTSTCPKQLLLKHIRRCHPITEKSHHLDNAHSGYSLSLTPFTRQHRNCAGTAYWRFCMALSESKITGGARLSAVTTTLPVHHKNSPCGSIRTDITGAGTYMDFLPKSNRRPVNVGKTN